VDALPAKDDTGSALVVSDLAAGSIVLRGEKGDVALVWKRGEKGGKRPLAPGPYYLIATRVERMQGKRHWFLSSTGPQQGAAMKLHAGKTKRMDVTDTVHFAGTMKPAKKGGAFQLGFSIKAAGGRGLSVYRDDRRVPVTFEVLSKGGKVLGSGNMNYG
jgi:hypothetical protein